MKLQRHRLTAQIHVLVIQEKCDIHLIMTRNSIMFNLHFGALSLPKTRRVKRISILLSFPFYTSFSFSQNSLPTWKILTLDSIIDRQKDSQNIDSTKDNVVSYLRTIFMKSNNKSYRKILIIVLEKLCTLFTHMRSAPSIWH